MHKVFYDKTIYLYNRMIVDRQQFSQ